MFKLYSFLTYSQEAPKPIFDPFLTYFDLFINFGPSGRCDASQLQISSFQFSFTLQAEITTLVIQKCKCKCAFLDFSETPVTVTPNRKFQKL